MKNIEDLLIIIKKQADYANKAVICEKVRKGIKRIYIYGIKK
mgnify:FL=1